MSAKIIDGKKISAEIKTKVRGEVEELKSKGILPGLATLLVGDNPASQIYLKNKHRASEEVGISSFNHVLSKEASMSEVLHKVDELNADEKVHAILIQLPLPPQIEAQEVLTHMLPKKDADGFHPQNLGRMFAAKDLKELRSCKEAVPLPCTPYGVLMMLESIGYPLAGKNAVVVGRSMIVGKPMAALLLANHATVTVAHSQTKNLVEYCRSADLVVAAIGKAQFVTDSMVKEGACVIDVGINRGPEGQITGDVCFETVKERAGWITPVPGGVGPMTIAMLLKNTVDLAKSQSRFK